ncbi:MAG: EAL domain-containing protein [Kiloniellales bacterium]|nr:EAL domain-containing protein [Kiloniellales bacterium]
MRSLQASGNARAEPQPASQEAVLRDYAERLRKFREGRQAVHLQIGRLRPENRRAHHLRIAQQAFEPLIQGYEGALFRLFNEDLVVTLNGAPKSRLDEVVDRLCGLFAEDPLLAAGAQASAFATHFDLEQDLELLISLADRMERARQDREAESAARAQAQGIAAERSTRGSPLDPEGLRQMVEAIVQADLSNFARRQLICVVIPGAPPQPVFRELYISTAALGQTLLPNREILGNRWLFQYLTQVLDQRVIAMLAKSNDILREGHIAINLNVETATSAAFLKLDDALNKDDRRKIIFEFQVIDVFADLARFAFARDFLRGKGYRVCLDGCSHLTLHHIDRQKLGVDFVKLGWSGALADHMAGAQGAAFVAAVTRMGAQRVILNRCDAPEALTVGQSLGIDLFQGYHLDNLLEGSELRHKPVTLLPEDAPLAAAPGGS